MYITFHLASSPIPHTPTFDDPKLNFFFSYSTLLYTTLALHTSCTRFALPSPDSINTPRVHHYRVLQSTRPLRPISLPKRYANASPKRLTYRRDVLHHSILATDFQLRQYTLIAIVGSNYPPSPSLRSCTGTKDQSIVFLISLSSLSNTLWMFFSR